jgi:hypothetical protein
MTLFRRKYERTVLPATMRNVGRYMLLSDGQQTSEGGSIVALQERSKKKGTALCSLYTLHGFIFIGI